MCELWGYLHPSLEAGRERPLPLQRLRPLLQDERTEPSSHQAQETAGQFSNILTSLLVWLYRFDCAHSLFLFYLFNLSSFNLVWRCCNLISFSPCLTGPVDYPFASCHKGPGFKSPGGYLCETGILLLALSRYIGDPDVIDHHCSLV
jgi:hypothetical protein